MKTILNSTAIATMLIACTGNAGTSWVESTFWKAPQAASFTLKLKGKEKLTKECGFYKKVVFNEDGSLSSTVSMGQLYKFRKLIDPVVLEIDVKPYARIEKKVSAEVSPDSDKLPYFTQSEAITGVLLGDASEVKIEGQENSYTDISRKAGYEISDINLSQNSRAAYVIKLQDRDIACDLFEGTGSIVVDAPSYVMIDEAGVTRINEFYNKSLLPSLNEVLRSKSELPAYKAARIGFRTGKVLEEEFPGLKDEITENQIREVMKSLFNPKTLELSSNVIRSGEQLHLNLDGGIEGKNLPVILEF